MRILKGCMIIISLYLISSNCFSQSLNWQWAKGIGGINYDEGSSTYVDKTGNLYVTGYYSSPTITFSTCTLTNVSPGAGGNDIFVVKYDASGNVLWAKTFGGTGDDCGYSICLDNNGNSYITGYFTSNTITFNNFVLVKTNSNAGVGNVFVVKCDTSGNVLWAKNAGGTYHSQSNSITVDSNGNSYLTGYFNGPSITFDTTTLTSINGIDLFIAKYDVTGNILWAKNFGGSSDDYGTRITVDINGNTYITGYFSSPTITFDTIALTNIGGYDLFIVKCDILGNILWAKSAGGTSMDYIAGISVDINGNSLVTGHFTSHSINFGSNNLTNSGTYGFFVAKYDSLGNVLWAKSTDSNSSAAGTYLTVDLVGNSYITGQFSGICKFGNNTITSNGSWDIFIAKYDNSGNVIWTKNAGGTNNDICISMAMDYNYNLYITGFFDSSTLSFGSFSLVNKGGHDIFIAKIKNTTEVDQFSFELVDWRVYPNPWKNEITTEVNTNEKCKLKIFNLNCQSIYSSTVDKNLIIDLSQLQKGVYIFELSIKNSIFTKKIIKQ